jgi:hypothetical protein
LNGNPMFKEAIGVALKEEILVAFDLSNSA